MSVQFKINYFYNLSTIFTYTQLGFNRIHSPKEIIIIISTHLASPLDLSH